MRKYQSDIVMDNIQENSTKAFNIALIDCYHSWTAWRQAEARKRLFYIEMCLNIIQISLNTISLVDVSFFTSSLLYCGHWRPKTEETPKNNTRIDSCDWSSIIWVKHKNLPKTRYARGFSNVV